MKEKSFKFYESFLTAAELLPEKDRGVLLYAIAKYGIEGVEIPLEKTLNACLIIVKERIDYQKSCSENGKKGGRRKYSSWISDFEREGDES